MDTKTSPILLQMFEAALAGEISYGQNMSVPARALVTESNRN